MDATPSTIEPVEPAPAPRRRRLLRATIASTLAVVVVGVPCALALYLTMGRGSADQTVSMVPADIDVYGTVLLDPSLDQKRNLQSVLQHFPGLQDEAAIRSRIDDGLTSLFKDSGLDYRTDVAPWLGSQVSFAVTLGDKPDYAMLARTKDEAAATAALHKGIAKKLAATAWTTQTYGGVTINVGATPGITDCLAGCSSSIATPTPSLVYAVFDHTAVIAQGTTLLHRLVDTSHGGSPSLAKSDAYAQVLQKLPGDHLTITYVNAASLVTTLKRGISQSTLNAMPPEYRSAMAEVDALQSVGISVQAESNAISSDVVTLSDPSKLSAAARDALNTAPQKIDALSWVPQDSFGVVAGAGRPGGQSTASLPAALIAILGMSSIGHTTAPSTGLGTPAPGSAPSTGDVLKELGLSGPEGLASHITGAAISVGPGDAALPVSAVFVITSNDAAGLAATTAKLADLVSALATPPSLCDALPPPGTANGLRTAPAPCSPATPRAWTTEHYGGVDIHSLALPNSAVSPAYAVIGGTVLIGSSTAAVRHAVDTHSGAPAITAAPLFRSSPASGASGSLVFVDAQRVVAAIDSALGGSDRAGFDKDALPYLRPLRTMVVTTSQSAAEQHTHMVVSVG